MYWWCWAVISPEYDSCIYYWVNGGESSLYRICMAPEGAYSMWYRVVCGHGWLTHGVPDPQGSVGPGGIKNRKKRWALVPSYAMGPNGDVLPSWGENSKKDGRLCPTLYFVCYGDCPAACICDFYFFFVIWFDSSIICPPGMLWIFAAII